MEQVLLNRRAEALSKEAEALRGKQLIHGWAEVIEGETEADHCGAKLDGAGWKWSGFCGAESMEMEQRA